VSILAATEGGLLAVDGGPDLLAGRSVSAVSGSWALSDDALVSIDTGVEVKLDGPRPWCLLQHDGQLYVGTAEARLFAGPSTTGCLTPVESFDLIGTRDEWYTPWGAPPDTRSLAAGDGMLFVNVHVGGVWRHDAGDGWSEVVSVDADTHQVATSADGDAVTAAAAIGFGRSLDGGTTWDWTTDGLHASYCRAVAVVSDTTLVTASTGPGSRRAGIYRRSLRATGPFEKCHVGLPEWFPYNLDTHQLATAGEQVVLGTTDGRVFQSNDAGATWDQVAAELPPVRAVVIRAELGRNRT
jgi:hypothetical protein